MWSKEHRAGQAAFERHRYPTDLTDPEWQVIRPLLPPSSPRGRRPGIDLREVLNAIRYLARAGLWLAHAAGSFWAGADRLLVVPAADARFLFTTLHNVALMLDRERVGPGQSDRKRAR